MEISQRATHLAEDRARWQTLAKCHLTKRVGRETEGRERERGGRETEVQIKRQRGEREGGGERESTRSSKRS